MRISGTLRDLRGFRGYVGARRRLRWCPQEVTLVPAGGWHALWEVVAWLLEVVARPPEVVACLYKIYTIPIHFRSLEGPEMYRYCIDLV